MQRPYIAQVTCGFLPSIWATSLHISTAWIAIFLLSRIPQAAANVAAEALAAKDWAWPLRATLYTQLWALPCNFLAAVVVSFMWQGRVSEVLEDYEGGLRCLVSCPGAAVSVLSFALPGMLYTLTEFQVLQVASATTYFLLAALQLPLQDLALSLLNSASFRAPMLPAMAVVVLGLVLYGWAQ